MKEEMTKEELALRYLHGFYTETQFQYWATILKYDVKELLDIMKQSMHRRMYSEFFSWSIFSVIFSCCAVLFIVGFGILSFWEAIVGVGLVWVLCRVWDFIDLRREIKKRMASEQKIRMKLNASQKS